MRRLTEHLYAETEYHWANVGAAATEAGIVLIDCPVRPSQSRHWQEALRPLSPKGIRYLITTDYHVDHTTGTSFLDGDFTFVAPQRVFDELAQIRGDTRTARKTYIDTLNDMDEPEEAELVGNADVPPPHVCFDDHMTLHLAPLTFEIYRKAGHSPACTSVLVPEERVLFSGDVMINEPGPGMRDASINQWIEALAWMEALPIDHIVPGHGEICTVREAHALKEQFIEIRGIMRDLVRAGLDKAEAVADAKFERFFWSDTSRGPSWIEGRRVTFRRGLERLYDEACEDVAAEAGERS
jgi:glyoxylase-like metal-dependent hydrolase (beta-lactamase superfamily II)